MEHMIQDTVQSDEEPDRLLSELVSLIAQSFAGGSEYLDIKRLCEQLTGGQNLQDEEMLSIVLQELERYGQVRNVGTHLYLRNADAVEPLPTDGAHIEIQMPLSHDLFQKQDFSIPAVRNFLSRTR